MPRGRTDGKTPATRQLNTGADVEADPYANEDRIELHVRRVREQWGENLPEGLLSADEYLHDLPTLLRPARAYALA